MPVRVSEGSFLLACCYQRKVGDGPWLKWQLKGDNSAAKMFVGPSCGLCTDPKWTIERKKLSQ